MMKHNSRSRFFIVINHVVKTLASPTDHVVSIYEFETSSFEERFLPFQPKKIFNGKSRGCQLTMSSGALNSRVYDGITLLLELT